MVNHYRSPPCVPGKDPCQNGNDTRRTPASGSGEHADSAPVRGPIDLRYTAHVPGVEGFAALNAPKTSPWEYHRTVSHSIKTWGLCFSCARLQPLVLKEVIGSEYLENVERALDAGIRRG